MVQETLNSVVVAAEQEQPQPSTIPASSTITTIEAVASAAAEAMLLQQQSAAQQQEQEQPQQPPPPLPPGWHLKESRSNPGYYYYFDQETGTCSWYPPELESYNDPSHNNEDDTYVDEDPFGAKATQGGDNDPKAVTPTVADAYDPAPDPPGDTNALLVASGSHNNKRPGAPDVHGDNASLTSKRQKVGSSRPGQVRILHILKKHAGSRRPSSWRQPKITIGLEEARAELEELLQVLKEESDEKALRATFEELARTESDCSSAKRGGDLGYFGPKKMQPAFEAASFALEIGELSDIIETSSGVHVLLRVG